MKSLLLILVPSIVVPFHALAGGRSYNDVADITHDCTKEPDVSVNTSSVTATFTGTCDKISLNGSSLKVKIAGVKRLAINGAENTVDVGGVDKVSVNGADNKVTYKKPIEDKKTKVTSTGAGNKITQTK